jgi:hypothetical protein
MLGNLYMQSADGGMTSLAVTDIPEFIPSETEETDKDRVLVDFSKPITLEFTGTISYVSARSRKWWRCLSLYGNWTAKGPIRMRMLKKATMQEKSLIRTYHIYQDEDGRFFYRRGDGAVVELKIDDETRAMHYE